MDYNTGPDKNTTNNKKPRENGGKYGHDDYPDAETIEHPVENCKAGDRCECCSNGKYYPAEDRKQLEFDGQPIITVKKHIKKVLRCNSCGHEVMSRKKIIKWSSKAKSTLVINKLFGTPMHRIERIQMLHNVPIAASTQWYLIKSVWEDAGKYIIPILYTKASNGECIDSDDTGYKILEVMENNKDLPKDEQRACHTTVVCVKNGEDRIVLYKTGNKYCRENLQPILDSRQNPEKVIFMSDASNMSLPKQEDLNGYICLLSEESTDFTDGVQKGHEIAVVKQDNNALKIFYKNTDDKIDHVIIKNIDKTTFKSITSLNFNGEILDRNKNTAAKKMYDFIYNEIDLIGADLGKIYSAVCLGGHGRRKFKDAAENYPEYCGFFLDLIHQIYSNEHACIDKPPDERLKYHQEHSSILIKQIYNKIDELYKEKLVEPNDDLGQALNYWLNHKKGLTLFLRVSGAKLDNNWSEQELRIIAILRNNSLFFKTLSSAEISCDLLSLIETCQVNEVNAFGYLNWIQDNWLAVQKNPDQYLPWHFKKPRQDIIVNRLKASNLGEI